MHDNGFASTNSVKISAAVMDGIQATESIKRLFPGVKVLVLTTHSDDEWLFDAIRSVANSYLLKDAPSKDLFKAIWATIAGDTPVRLRGVPQSSSQCTACQYA
jgi:DNA-binding NarL/FixJ family response regulator